MRDGAGIGVERRDEGGVKETRPACPALIRGRSFKGHVWAHTQPGEYCDPVTFKTFNENTHIVAIKVSGNVYEAETIERLNAKTKNWRDLLSDEPFTRKDIIDLHVRPGLGARAGGRGGGDEEG